MFSFSLLFSHFLFVFLWHAKVKFDHLERFFSWTFSDVSLIYSLFSWAITICFSNKHNFSLIKLYCTFNMPFSFSSFLKINSLSWSYISSILSPSSLSSVLRGLWLIFDSSSPSKSSNSPSFSGPTLLSFLARSTSFDSFLEIFSISFSISSFYSTISFSLGIWWSSSWELSWVGRDERLADYSEAVLLMIW